MISHHAYTGTVGSPRGARCVVRAYTACLGRERLNISREKPESGHAAVLLDTVLPDCLERHSHPLLLLELSRYAHFLALPIKSPLGACPCYAYFLPLPIKCPLGACPCYAHNFRIEKHGTEYGTYIPFNMRVIFSLYIQL